MYYETNPGIGATLSWVAATRGGSNEPIGVIIAVRVGSVTGVANSGISIDLDAASGHAVNVSMSDNGEVSARRYNAAAGSSRSTGTVATTGLLYLWVDMPTAMLTGTNATVYTFTDSATTQITMTGATSPAGTAADINGAISVAVGNDSKGHWKVEKLYVFVGTDRPDIAAEARAVALGDTAASGYTGLKFSAELVSSYTDSIAGTTAPTTGGMLEVITGVVSMLDTTCAILRSKPDVGSNTGSPIYPWYTFTDEALCHVQDSGSAESLANLRQTGTTGINVFLECGRDVRNGDRIELDEASLGTRLLSVIGPPVMDPHRSHYTMVPCEEIQGGGGT